MDRCNLFREPGQQEADKCTYDVTGLAAFLVNNPANQHLRSSVPLDVDNAVGAFHGKLCPSLVAPALSLSGNSQVKLAPLQLFDDLGAQRLGLFGEDLDHSLHSKPASQVTQQYTT